MVPKERCESGRIGLTANELTWETGSEGSNPSLSAHLIREGVGEMGRGVGGAGAGVHRHHGRDTHGRREAGEAGGRVVSGHRPRLPVGRQAQLAVIAPAPGESVIALSPGRRK